MAHSYSQIQTTKNTLCPSVQSVLNQDRLGQSADSIPPLNHDTISLNGQSGQSGQSFFSLVGSFSQLAFIENDVSLMSRHVFGNAGEAWAYAEFERAGYQVARVRQGDQRGDLRVVDMESGEVWRIEVKSARRDKRGHWQVCLKRQIKARVCTDSAHSDYVLLLLFPKVGAPTPFLIPVAATHGARQIHIASDPRLYAGKWSAFRQLRGLKMPDISRED